MKKIVASCLFIFLSGHLLTAQSDLSEKVLFTVSTDTVTAGEYMAVYNKNRNIGEDIDPKTPREYLDLYINFKLKVHEAKALGMDTADAFVREYSGYRDQLAKPYLSDKDVTEDLIMEAYERMYYDVRASHIMISVPEGASPEDTLEAFNKALTIKKQIEKGGSFEEMAKEYSADPYSAERGGDLGYFTVFNMVYPFENAVYNADIGEMVGPVRTKFGYHIIKTTDKRPARQEIIVNHILLISNDKSTEAEKEAAAKKIGEIHEQLEEGGDFATLAKQYSEDPTSAKKGGRLFPFGINKMFPKFEEAAYTLKDQGDYSEPVLTPVGWHIIQLVKKEDFPDEEKAKREIKIKLDSDQRSLQSRLSIIKKLKKEYNFREYPRVMKLAFEGVDNSVLNSKFENKESKSSDKILFEFAENTYTVDDFYDYLQANQRGVKGDNLYSEVNKAYTDFSEGELIAYEKSKLKEKYPEFKLLSREYFEGILLFDLTEKKVWQKSVSDSAGLYDYYANNKDSYKWKERYQVYIIDAASAKIAGKAEKMLKKEMTIAEIQKELNEDSELNVKIDSGVYEMGTNSILEGLEKVEGFTDKFEKDGRVFVVKFEKIIPPGTKSFEEARGLVISDYQNHLENTWIKELKEKYEVQINEDVLQKVITRLESKS